MTISPDTPIDDPRNDTLWQPDAAVDGHYADWLLRRGLLTPDLQASLGEAVVIDVIREAHGAAPSWTADLVAAQQSAGWCREITMSFGGTVYVHAECFAPTATIQAHPWLKSLGARPLGSALANLDDTRRVAMAFNQCVRTRDVRVATAAWARRSQFDVQGHPLFLIEYLSPALAHIPRESC
ncbi:MAG: chorismate lyase [Pseudomonadota bacterium]